MDHRDMLIGLWHHLKLPGEAIAACSREYDLLCPHCKIAGRGDVHLRVLPDNTGFQCADIGHKYRAFRSEVPPFAVTQKKAGNSPASMFQQGCPG
jgi:hypothetical protein